MNNNNNNNSGGYVKVNTSTNSIGYFDDNGIMMMTSFLNDTITISFGEPVVNAEGKRKYPQELRSNLLITNERVAALYNGIIMNKVMPAVNSGENYNGGVFLDNTKKDKVFEIRIQDGDIYALYHFGIDADRHPKKTIVYKFKKSPLIEKYDPASGEFNIVEGHSQFYLFIKQLEGFLTNCNGTVTHDYKNTNRYSNDKLFNLLNEIAVKLGVSVNAPQYTSYSNNNTNSTSTASPAIQETTDLSSLLG